MQRPAPAGPGDDQACSLLVRGACERLHGVAVLDVDPHEPALQPGVQRFGVADGAPAVFGAVVTDEDRPRLSHRGVRWHGHDRARCFGGERSRDAAVKRVLEPSTRRRFFEGLNLLEVAPQLGHKPSTCLDIYGRLFEEFDPSPRRPAVDVIRRGEGGDPKRSGAHWVPAAGDGDVESDVAAVEEGD